jgi:single-stranded-DNA-specific exonuclease
LRPTLRIDAEVQFSQLNEVLYEALCALEPCGHDHPTPILCSRRLRVVDKRLVGKDNAHLKLRLSDGDQALDAIAFRLGELNGDLPAYVDVAYQLDLNEWNGSRRLQLRVQDVHESA